MFDESSFSDILLFHIVVYLNQKEIMRLTQICKETNKILLNCGIVHPTFQKMFQSVSQFTEEKNVKRDDTNLYDFLFLSLNDKNKREKDMSVKIDWLFTSSVNIKLRVLNKRKDNMFFIVSYPTEEKHYVFSDIRKMLMDLYSFGGFEGSNYYKMLRDEDEDGICNLRITYPYLMIRGRDVYSSQEEGMSTFLSTFWKNFKIFMVI